MVSIDTVYQKVQAIANKEQRGYITPQEFNLLANQAQLDIFEQYFYDLNQFRRVNGNDTVYGDMVDFLEEKIDIFRAAIGQSITSNFTVVGNGYRLPSYIYRIDQVRINDKQCQRLTGKKYNLVRTSPLTKPTPARPIFTIREDVILVNDGVSDDGNGYVDFEEKSINISYIKKPTSPKWNGFNVGTGFLYNETGSNNFDLHGSEENKLVIKILQLAGVSIKDPNLYQIASAEDTKNIQQEKQ